MQNVTENTPLQPNPIRNSDERNSRFIWGILLVLGGFIFLLQQFSIFHFVSGLIWVALFAAGAIFFGGWFLRNPRANWWAAIPGFTLAGLASVSMIDQLGIQGLDSLSGPLFLASIGLAFAVIFLVNSEMWWALIPGGVMMTLAVVAYADDVGIGIDSGAILFLGMGLTFIAVGAMPGHDGKSRRWAFIPAAVLLGMGFLIGFSMEVAIQYLWPIAMIIGGALLIGKTMFKNQSS